LRKRLEHLAVFGDKSRKAQELTPQIHEPEGGVVPPWDAPSDGVGLADEFSERVLVGL
jgi:hypothetical protein